MSNLKEQIRQRRIELGGESEPCASFSLSGASTLRLEASSGVTWVLPWHHFVACWLDDESDREMLRLVFVGHEVVIRGLRLKQLLDAVARQSLAALRAIPQKYAPADTEGALVLEIEVRPREGAL